MDKERLLGLLRGVDLPERVAVLETGVRCTNARAEDEDHAIVLVEGGDRIRLLNAPRHPETGESFDVSVVPRMVAEDAVGRGHRDDPIRYRFLDNLRSAEPLEDPDGVGRDLVDEAADHVATDRLLGDYVDSLSGFVEDMWGLLQRGDLRGARECARDVVAWSLGILWEEETGRRPLHAGSALLVEELGAEHEEAWDRLFPRPDDGRELAEAMVDAAAAAGGDAAPRERLAARERSRVGRELLANVEEVLVPDLADAYGDALRAVGATGSIGRKTASEGADYDVHVLVDPDREVDRHRLDFHLFVPSYPGLDRMVQLIVTPTTFAERILEEGPTVESAAYHLNHLRNTELVHDPDGLGARYQDEAWDARPPEDHAEDEAASLRSTLAKAEGAPPRAETHMWALASQRAARLALRQHGMGYVKPKYRSTNLDLIRPDEPAFFEAYHPLLGLHDLDEKDTREVARGAHRLFEAVLEELDVDYRFRPPEADGEL